MTTGNRLLIVSPGVFCYADSVLEIETDLSRPQEEKSFGGRILPYPESDKGIQNGGCGRSAGSQWRRHGARASEHETSLT